MGTFPSKRHALHLCACLAGFTSPAWGQTLQAIAANNPPRIQIFLSGSLRDVVGQEGNGPTSTGSLGLRYIGPTYVATGMINVAGEFDTLVTGFGATMLPPSNSQGFNGGLLDIRRRFLPGKEAHCNTVRRFTPKADTLRSKYEEVPKFMQGRIGCALGLHLYLGVSTARWATARDAETGAATATVDVPVWGSGLGLTYTFVDRRMRHDDEEKDVAMVLDFGLATRHLRGDLASDRRDALRGTILGTDRRNFIGPEIGLGIQYENITAALTYYFFGNDIDGFSHGQVVAGVSIQASLNDWQLGPPPQPTGTPAESATPPAPPADTTDAPPPADAPPETPEEPAPDTPPVTPEEPAPETPPEAPPETPPDAPVEDS